MASPCTVRELRWSDFQDLVQNYYEAYEERESGTLIGITLFATKPSLPDEGDWFARLFRRVQEGTEIARVAEADGHAVGFCAVTPRMVRTHEMGHVGDLGILVRRSYRGRGVGEALMRAVIEQCRPRLELLVLSVFHDNEPAQRLYRKVGFQLVGTIPGEVKRGNAYFASDLMYLTLGPPPAQDGAR